MALHPHASRTALLSGIYAIVNEAPRVIDLTRAILEGGVRIVQYRAKSHFDGDHARALREITASAGALFLLNDLWQEVERYGADGAHIGPDDARADQLPHIRRALGGKILGLSCGTADEARAAQRTGADYIGVGCVFPTASKDDAGEPIGIDGLRRVAAAASVPCAAIGGITHDNLAAVRSTGVAMAAVISTLSAAPDARAAAQELVRAWQGHG